MDILLRQIEPIKNQGMFFSPISGDRKLPTCATRDIAAVAAKLLLDHSWSGQDSIPVLGPEDLSFNDMAQIMSEVLGKPVRFQQILSRHTRPVSPNRGCPRQWRRSMIDMRLGKTRAPTMPSRAPRRPPPPPASASGASKCSNQPSWPETSPASRFS